MVKMSGWTTVALAILIIGGLNWLLVGLGYNVIQAIFGADSVILRLIYILVGVCAIVMIYPLLASISHKEEAPATR
jgi:uncharacterized membrane protein YuzA (DUF378 family)